MSLNISRREYEIGKWHFNQTKERYFAKGTQIRVSEKTEVKSAREVPASDLDWFKAIAVKKLPMLAKFKWFEPKMESIKTEVHQHCEYINFFPVDESDARYGTVIIETFSGMSPPVRMVDILDNEPPTVEEVHELKNELFEFYRKIKTRSLLIPDINPDLVEFYIREKSDRT